MSDERERLHVSCTTDELNEIDRLAAAAGTSRSKFMIRTALESPTKISRAEAAKALRSIAVMLDQSG